jgi:hypothetical protein
LPGVFPDQAAPVVRNQVAGRELIKMRWGMPPPPKFGGPPVTNIRNTSSPHWRGWLKPESRCLVPASSFSEYAPDPNPATGKKDVVWFTAYTQALERLAQAPGWDNVDEDQQKKLAAPLERGTTRDQERVPIPQLRSELDACETRLQDAKLRRLVAARKTAISLSHFARIICTT